MPDDQFDKPGSGNAISDALPPTRSESTLARNGAGAGIKNISHDESLLKGSEPLFIASGKQYSIVAFPDDKTGTGRLNAAESDRNTRQDSCRWNHLPKPYVRKHCLAITNMLRAILKVKGGARRVDGLSSQPGEGLSPQHPAPTSTRLDDYYRHFIASSSNKCYFVLHINSFGELGDMLTVNIRKQGGASVITIPPDVLRTLHVGVGATLSIEFSEGAVTLRPVTSNNRKRYTLAELMEGVTPELITELNTEMAWSLDIEPVGREIL